MPPWFADQSSEDAGERARDPACGATELYARCNAGEAGNACEDQQAAEDIAENHAAQPQVQNGAEQAARRAGDAEAPEHAPVDMLADDGEAQSRAEEMGNGNDGDRQLGADPGGEKRRQDAANAEAGDGGDGAGEKAREGEKEGVRHDAGASIWSLFSTSSSGRERSR